MVLSNIGRCLLATEKTRNGFKWTESQFRSFIISMLRKGSTRWGPRNEAKKAARHDKKLPNSTGRYVFHSKCASCKELVPETTAAVDHIDPVVDPIVGFEGFETYIKRMYCEEEGFQVLCAQCHDKKTEEERSIATERKRKERES